MKQIESLKMRSNRDLNPNHDWHLTTTGISYGPVSVWRRLTVRPSAVSDVSEGLGSELM